MFYAMTRLHFDESRLDELMEKAESIRGRVEAIDGLLFAELIETGEGQGMIIAAYDHEPTTDSMGVLLEEWSNLLTSAPHGHEGTVVLRYGRSPAG